MNSKNHESSSTDSVVSPGHQTHGQTAASPQFSPRRSRPQSPPRKTRQPRVLSHPHPPLTSKNSPRIAAFTYNFRSKQRDKYCGMKKNGDIPPRRLTRTPAGLVRGFGARSSVDRPRHHERVGLSTRGEPGAGYGDRPRPASHRNDVHRHDNALDHVPVVRPVAKHPVQG